MSAKVSKLLFHTTSRPNLLYVAVCWFLATVFRAPRQSVTEAAAVLASDVLVNSKRLIMEIILRKISSQQCGCYKRLDLF